MYRMTKINGLPLEYACMAEGIDIFPCVRSHVPYMDFNVYKLYGGRKDGYGRSAGKILYSVIVSGSVYPEL